MASPTAWDVIPLSASEHASGGRGDGRGESGDARNIQTPRHTPWPGAGIRSGSGYTADRLHPGDRARAAGTDIARARPSRSTQGGSRTGPSQSARRYPYDNTLRAVRITGRSSGRYGHSARYYRTSGERPVRAIDHRSDGPRLQPTSLRRRYVSISRTPGVALRLDAPHSCAHTSLDDGVRN